MLHVNYGVVEFPVPIQPHVEFWRKKTILHCLAKVYNLIMSSINENIPTTHLDGDGLEPLLGGLDARLCLVLLPRHVVDHGLEVLELGIKVW